MLRMAQAISHNHMQSFLRWGDKQITDGFDKVFIVSIIDPGQCPLIREPMPGARSLEMEDLTPAQFHDGTKPNHSRYPRQAHATEIVRFVREAHASPSDDMLLVNCGAGVSRSGAVAAFARDIFDMDQHEHRHRNAHTIPNRYLLKLLDDAWTDWTIEQPFYYEGDVTHFVKIDLRQEEDFMWRATTLPHHEYPVVGGHMAHCDNRVAAVDCVMFFVEEAMR